ncbi:hypothetical protein PoB_003015400 [Plakobranchus ocellatus]|uniref:Uncharacterized protein n=1 Tax=Plakobranchus ocellatus TaxID=259542 RepID=A0AAV4A7K7_9GAST|nr:hypothetical protein PoB_003015400 [Plakobranchus ocellatus]
MKSAITACCRAISLIQRIQRPRLAAGLSVSSKEISDHALLQGYQSRPMKLAITACCRAISLIQGIQRSYLAAELSVSFRKSAIMACCRAISLIQ